MTKPSTLLTLLTACAFVLTLCCHIASAEKTAGTSALTLSDSERAWLAEHSIIRVAYDGNFPPYSVQNDDGEFEGLAVGVMQVLAERIGVRFKPLPQGVWKDLYAAAQRREVDVVATMGDRPERHEWFLFTRPYIFKSLVIMTRDQEKTIQTAEDLAGKRVALVQSYQYVQPLLEKYPSITPYYVDTMLDGFNAVVIGKADAVITYTGAGHYLKTKYQLANLKFAAVFERDRYTESIAVRSDWPELAVILDKALDTISEEEMLTLNQPWIGSEMTHGIAPRLVFAYLAAILGGIVVLIVVFVTWNRALKNQVKQRTVELRRELTDRNIAEHELAASELRFREILENVQLITVLLDENGNVTFCNDFLLNITGYTREEMLNFDWFNRMIPGTNPEVKEIFLKGLKNGEITPYFKNPIVSADGTLRHILWNNTVLRDATGHVKGVASIGEDITAREQAELELENHREHLEALVAEQTGDLKKTQQALQFMLEDLNEANARLREVDQLKSMFIASMSHELRTPLNSVIGFSSILLNEWTGPLNDEQKQNVGSVLRSGKHLLSLINDVIDISKVEAGMIETSIDAFELGELLTELEENFAKEAQDRKLTLAVQAFTLPIYSDRRRLLQCLFNMVSNALKFTETGGVTVAVEHDSAEGKVTFIVTDSGIGIAVEDQARLFQAFSRIQSDLSAKVLGTGLGLYLTRKIVIETLHGEINVSSAAGQGSSFSMTIPVRIE